jgi:hypothetical protein
VQAALQHVPPTQKVLVHWSVAVHAVPAAAVGTHVVPLQ